MSLLTTFRDLLSPLHEREFWSFMAAKDIKHKYKRSVIGPFWLTITNGAYIGMLAFVFGTLFRTEDPLYVPWVATGVLMWNFISTVLRESTTIFIDKKGFLLQSGDFQPSQLLFWLLWRNILILFHQLPIVIVTLLWFHSLPDWQEALMIVPGFILLILLLWPVSLCVSLLTARFRDLDPLINTALMLLFFVTPIMWMPAQLGDKWWLASWNPATYVIDILRAPLIGAPIHEMTYIVCASMAIATWAFTILLYNRFAKRIVFWV